MIKSLRLLKVMLLACVMLPLSAGAVDVGNLTYDLNEENLTATVTGWVGGSDAAEGELIIPSTIESDGKTYTVTAIGYNAFNGCSGLTGSLVIPETVTSIGGSAFYGCNRLDGTLTLSKSLTVIEYNAFSGCSNLTGAVVIPNTVTTFGERAFEGCSELTSITLPEGLETIGTCTFRGCSSLTSLEIPSSVTSIGSDAFYGCSSLTSINIPNGVKKIESTTFYQCSSLTSLEIPSSVTSIGDNAFNGCTKLASINLPEGVKKIEYQTFYQCSSLTSLEIPSSVTSIGHTAFYGCSSLASLEIPATVTTIGEWAFGYCSALTSINIPDGVKKIDNYTFYLCSSLTSLEIPSSVNAIGAYAFNNCTKLASVNIPDGVKAIENGTFANCSSLTSLEIPSSITSIGKEAFNGCSKLESVNIPDGVKAIENSTFYGCSSLTSLEIPSSVTSIGDYAFNSCSKLESVNIPEGVKAIENGTFFGCSSLTSLEIPSSVASIGEYAFSNCQALSQIVIPEAVTSIGRNAFSSCNNFLLVTILSDNVTFDSEIFAYSNISQLFCPESLDITPISSSVQNIRRFKPDGAKLLADGTLLTDNGKTLFYAAAADGADYVIPEGVTTIAHDAFTSINTGENLKLASLTIPSTIEVIEPGVFESVQCGRVNFNDWSKWYSTVKLGNLHSNPYWNSTPYAGGVKITTPEFVAGQTEIPDYVNAGLYFTNELELPTTIKRIGAYAFYNNTELYSVILPAGLEEIGESAFEGCSLLENPSFPASLKKIEDGAYKGCTSITEITLPEGLTMLGEMTPYDYTTSDGYDSATDEWRGDIINGITAKGVFQDCTALERAVLVADIDYIDDNLFSGCTSLEKIFFPLQLKNLGSFAFYETALDEVTFPATLENIGEYAFAKEIATYIWNWDWNSTPGLTSLTIPNSVTTIGTYAFLNQHISNLTLGSGLEAIAEGAFLNNKLEIINFADGLKEIGAYAFGNSQRKAERYGKGLISEVTLPSTVTAIAQNAFANTAICEMNVPDNVVSLPEGSCGSPSTLTIGTGIKEIASTAFSFDQLYTLRVKALNPPTLSDAFPLTTDQNDQLTLIVNKDRKKYYETNARWKQIDRIIEDGQSDVVIYMSGASLAEEIRMTTGLMPSSVTKMKVVGDLTANDLAIIKENMKALTSLDMSQVKGVTALPEGQFAGSLLTDIILPAGLEEIGANAFANCGLLQIETLPAALKTIGDNAFTGSPRLNISELPAALETIGNYAFASTGIQQITGNPALKELGYGAFSGCTLLEVADLSASALTSIPDNAFSGCSELDEVRLPQSVAQVGSNAFSGTAIRNIDFLNSVTEIGYGAFSGNRRLVAATLPKNVKNVASNIFSDCPRLLAVSMPSTTAAVGSQILTGDKKLSNISCAAIDAPTAESGAFDGLRMRYVSLIVPTQSYRSYLSAAGWGKFESIKNQITVEIDEGVDVSAVAEEEYQQMLQEDALEEAEDAAAEESGEMEASRAGRRAVARVATVNQFASLFNGAQIQTGDEDSGMRVFINPDNGVEVTSILFDGQEMIAEYKKNHSVLLPKGGQGKLRILTGEKMIDDTKPTPGDGDDDDDNSGDGTTAIDSVDDNVEASVTVDGGDIVISGGDVAVVYNLAGVRVATVREGRVTGLQRGIYIVRRGGKAVKVRL